ncbi:endonuclease/exonuclease/phosphatase family metal-dependent hydrolase [Filimonas zeae]|nr:endonuclease/exonuclease/phosphatase family protein [Filimonas zeae]MDR6342726.1 endonuclease/exonuclease/phosphatase family metal-dependent hydrolase [Filimonas zeae]
MKKFFIACYRLGCWAVMPVYILCALSSYLSPSVCFFTDALALGFPFVLLALLLVMASSLLFKNKRIAIISLLVLLTGFANIRNTIAFNPFAPNAPEKSDSSITVLTWNVFFFLNDHEIKDDTIGNPRREMINTIVNSNADVLCFQEYLSYNNGRGLVSMSHILDSLGYKYKVFSNDHIYQVAGGYSEVGAMLFSKLPIADSGRIAFNNGSKEHAPFADVVIKERKVRVIAAHLASLGLYSDTANTGQGSENVYKLSYKRKGSIARKIKKTALEHAREAAILDSAFKASPHPVVFCADMNSVPASYTYKKVRGDMQDAFLKKGLGLGQTYDALSPTLRIDVCLADKRLLVQHCKVERVHLSDHFPVITTLAVPK